MLSALEPGEIVTYGEVAREAGFPGAARAVGTLLSRGDSSLPWWRVVTANGRLVPGGEREQARLLRAEGVTAAGGHVRRPQGKHPEGSRHLAPQRTPVTDGD